VAVRINDVLGRRIKETKEQSTDMGEKRCPHARCKGVFNISTRTGDAIRRSDADATISHGGGVEWLKK
jgi:hypothetical protein